MTPAALVDTHCHLDGEQFRDDLPQVLSRAAAAGVGRCVIPATDVTSCRAALALAGEHRGLAVAVGVHPCQVPAAGPGRDAVAELAELATAEAVVAVGETGLDYLRGPDHGAQREWLQAHLALADRQRLPVILHNRDATADLVAELERWQSHGRPVTPRGVLHAFSAPLEVAQWAIGAGFLLGVGGMVTFRRSSELQTTLQQVPVEYLVLETDAPYLTPEPRRGRRNEPAYVQHTAAFLADQLGIAPAALADATSANAARLFPRLAARGALPAAV